MRKLFLAVGFASLVLPVTAQAHFNLTMPPSIAKSTEGGKGNAPCGPDTATTGTITPVTGGQMLTLHIDETVMHPGFYRFALSMVSPPTFPADNVVKDANGMVLTPTSQANSASAEFEDPAKFPVLADHVFAHTSGGAQSFPSATVPGQVMVPNVNCEKCTLQVIEFMANHGSNGASAGFFYHHCALLKITADPNQPIFDPNNPNAAGGAGGAGGASGAAGAVGSVAGSAGASVGGASGGAGGAPSGAAGAATAGAPTSAGASSAGASSAGASAAGTSAAGASAAGASSVPASGPAADDGGCSMSPRAAGSVPLFSLLLGLFALGRRRSRRG